MQLIYLLHGRRASGGGEGSGASTDGVDLRRVTRHGWPASWRTYNCAKRFFSDPKGHMLERATTCRGQRPVSDL